MLPAILVVTLCLGQDLAEFAKSHLPDGTELAHPPVAGSFGPAGKHIVLLYRPMNDSGEFKGSVYIGGERASELPEIGLIPNQFAIEVQSVFFEKPPAGASADLFILYAYHRNGSESDDGYACLIYRWRDNRFVRVNDLEKKVTNLPTAAAVRRRLRQIHPNSGGSKQ